MIYGVDVQNVSRFCVEDAYSTEFAWEPGKSIFPATLIDLVLSLHQEMLLSGQCRCTNYLTQYFQKER